MLIQVLFAVVMLFGVAALYADLGMARLAQIQMQNTADTAALEGLRYRDASDGVCTQFTDERKVECENLPNADGRMRWFAAQAASGFGAGGLWQGAGPRISLEDRDIDYSSTADNPSFRPTLQSNAGNVCEGDMVTGFYDPFAAHAEDATYVRPDFTRQSGVADDCANALVPDAPAAILVRLRRTGENFAGSDSSSNGPAMPLLFGQASTLQTVGASSPKVDGIPVRATAIASVRPVKRVGPPVPEAGIPGMTPFSVRIDCLADLTQIGCVGSPANEVGATVAPGVSPVNADGYIPVYGPPPCPGSPPCVIVGFWRGQVAGGVLTRFSGYVASANATAFGSGPAPSTTDYPDAGFLLAPVLVR